MFVSVDAKEEQQFRQKQFQFSIGVHRNIGQLFTVRGDISGYLDYSSKNGKFQVFFK